MAHLSDFPAISCSVASSTVTFLALRGISPRKKHPRKRTEKKRIKKEEKVKRRKSGSIGIGHFSKVCTLVTPPCKIKHASWKVLIAAISKLFRARPHLPLPPPRFFPVRFSCFDDQIIIKDPPRKGDSPNYLFNWSSRGL